MPLPFLAIAVPVLHSSGGWIASTAATGYVAGTLSGTWISAFVLGNTGLLSSLGLVSAAGIFGASGGIAALTSGAAVGTGSALTTVGLGAVATTLGIAPAVTFLGVTPVGWAIGMTAASLTAGLGYYFSRKVMLRINEERQKGGMGPITAAEIIKEVRLFERQALLGVLDFVERTTGNVRLSSDRTQATINGQVYSVGRLELVMNKDGSAEIAFVSRTGRRTRLLLIKGGFDGTFSAPA